MTTFAFSTVAGMGGGKPGDVGDSRTAAFELEKAFHPCPKVSHPLSEPWVLWVPVVSLSVRAAQVECMVNGVGQFRDHSV